MFFITGYFDEACLSTVLSVVFMILKIYELYYIKQFCRSLLLYLGLSWTILEYLGISTFNSVYLGLS